MTHYCSLNPLSKVFNPVRLREYLLPVPMCLCCHHLATSWPPMIPVAAQLASAHLARWLLFRHTECMGVNRRGVPQLHLQRSKARAKGRPDSALLCGSRWRRSMDGVGTEYGVVCVNWKRPTIYRWSFNDFLVFIYGVRSTECVISLVLLLLLCFLLFFLNTPLPPFLHWHFFLYILHTPLSNIYKIHCNLI